MLLTISKLWAKTKNSFMIFKLVHFFNIIPGTLFNIISGTLLNTIPGRLCNIGVILFLLLDSEHMFFMFSILMSYLIFVYSFIASNGWQKSTKKNLSKQYMPCLLNRNCPKARCESNIRVCDLYMESCWDSKNWWKWAWHRRTYGMNVNTFSYRDLPVPKPIIHFLARCRFFGPNYQDEETLY